MSVLSMKAKIYSWNIWVLLHKRTFPCAYSWANQLLANPKFLFSHKSWFSNFTTEIFEFCYINALSSTCSTMCQQTACQPISPSQIFFFSLKVIILFFLVKVTFKIWWLICLIGTVVQQCQNTSLNPWGPPHIGLRCCTLTSHQCTAIVQNPNQILMNTFPEESLSGKNDLSFAAVTKAVFKK